MALALLIQQDAPQELLEELQGLRGQVESFPWFNRPFFTLGGEAVTLASVISFVAFLLLALLASTFLQRALRRVFTRRGIDVGVQHALTRLAHYGVVAVGLYLALANLGIDLTALAGLGAVVAVAIGFGLQNHTQNLLGGLVLLFERPVKQGDFVEVGTARGTVRDIRARATVVTTLDNVDIVVPNGKFMTEPVINQTLADRRVRVRIDLRASYAADPERVRGVLEGVAAAHPAVLAEPPPIVWLTNFGESSLDFALLVWLEPLVQPQVTSDLRFAIDRAFREAGIEIPVPQREVRVKG